MKKWSWFPALMVLLLGCTPKLNDGISPTQPVVGNSPFPNPWVMYDDSLHTGGGFFFFPGVPPTQTVNVADQADPEVGKVSFNYILSDYGGQTFAGVIFSNTPDYHNFGTVPGPDMSGANFTKVTFWARANQVATISMAAAGGSNTNIALTPTWTLYTITSLGNMTNVQDFFTIAINNGQVPQSSLPFQVNVDEVIYQ